MPHSQHPCPYCHHLFAEALAGASKGHTHCPHCGKRVVWYVGFAFTHPDTKDCGWGKPTISDGNGYCHEEA